MKNMFRGTRLAASSLLAIASLIVGSVASAPAVVASEFTPTALTQKSSVIDGWVGAWGTAMTDGEALGDCTNDCTIRNTATMSIAGTQVRVTISNRYGTQPLTVGHATVSKPTGAGYASAVVGSVADIKFSGSLTAVIPAGQELVSDALSYSVVAGQDLHVSVYTPGAVPKFTRHPSANHDTFRASGGDKAGVTTGASFTANNGSNYLVSGVDVMNSEATGTIVALGDSITDGIGSSHKKNDRWTDRLAYRLQSLTGGPKYGVVNAGISANRVLISNSSGAGERAVDRAAWDVFNKPNVKVLILFMGINDIQQDPSQLDANQIAAGLKSIADEAHSRGIRVVGGTITPWRGWGTYTTQREATRVAFNTWVRGQAVTSGTFDAIVDFDEALRDAADPTKIVDAYDSGDDLHPGPLGFSAMASSIDLEALLGTNPHDDGDWVGAWGAPPAETSTYNNCTDCTVRTPMHLSVAGNGVRVVLSNVFGQQPLTVQRTTVAHATAPGSPSAQAGSIVPVTFGGSQSVTIPVGEQVVSDPADLAVTTDQDLLVSSYAPGSPSFDRHAEAKYPTYRSSGQGDQSAATAGSAFQAGSDGATFLVTRVDVLNPTAAGSIVAFGDSITDGVGANRQLNERWPDRLAERLNELAPEYRAGIVNTGIGYNRILVDNDQGSIGGQSAIKRFQRDVLNVPNVKTVVIMVGINDIQGSNVLDAGRISAGLRALITAARAQGVRVVGATLTPWRGAPGYNNDRENTRQQVNSWIRSSGAFDAVVDFDAATGNVGEPARFYRAYDSGDAIHPSAAGYRAMASAVDLAQLGLYESPGALDVSFASNPPSGGSATVTARFWPAAAGDGKLVLKLPAGWTTNGTQTVDLGPVTPGGSLTARWRINVPQTSESQEQIVVSASVDGRVASAAKTVTISSRPLAGTVNVSDLTFTSTTVGWGSLHRDEDMDGGPIDIGGQTFAKGLVANAAAEIKISLTTGACTTFATTVGVDPNHNGSTEGSVTFVFLLDGNVVQTVGTNAAPITASSPGTPVSFSVAGAAELTLRATDAGNGANSDHAAWGNPVLTCGEEQLPATHAALSVFPATPGLSGWYTGDVIVSASGTGGDGDLYTEIESAGAWAEYLTPVGVPQGIHHYAARATDRWGTVSEVASLTVRRDSVAPTVSATVADATLTLVAHDDTSGVATIEYRPDGTGAWTAYAGPAPLAESTRSVAFRATDVAGNTSAVATVTVSGGGTDPGTDRVTPALSVTPAKASAKYGKSASFEVRVHAASVVPTGTVSVIAGGKTLATAAVSGGRSRLVLPKTLKVGRHALVIRYSGDAKVLPATTTANVAVARAKAKVKVKIAHVGSKASKRVRITTKVTAGNGVRPQGTVRVTVHLGKKKVVTKKFKATAKKNSKAVTLKLPRAGRYKVTTKYLGSQTVAPKSAVKQWRLR
ncbi:GDSL-type esterase/lipase family protein [Rarobacter faecitabidus]|nr:GDSL-type esterase/lipase family protein [Rarobacter faecitabidus]